ncbi:hypothetical protein [Pontibacter sp. G13]|uniref:hypothetical protein n=1 Tax=Pontibacter sp. G13 TaxID=3074898 RepID=UPI002889B843|nr:hypothetical protein [Pontibacter sp. G13]WNJ19305.1 hypothetical protein RJD25_02335 [Pontibacter sp. G13]
MIFQGAIDLEIPGRTVQAVIDFETGLVGFVEWIDGETKEYLFHRCPHEFRMAFFRKMEDRLAPSNLHHSQISRNGEWAKWTRSFNSGDPTDGPPFDQ